MKKFTEILSVIILTVMSCSCSDFLNIVPDNVATVDKAFTMRNNAERYLFTCYSYIPDPQSLDAPGVVGCDETTVSVFQSDYYDTYSWFIARGYQSPTLNYYSPWVGTYGPKCLFQGIRDCNVFLDKIGSVPDMEEEERLRWIAEVKALKAYFHFYLIRCYGPIPLKDKSEEIGASIEDVHAYRNTIEECFDYVVDLLDEVINSGNLPNRITAEAEEKGRLTNGILMALKAEVLMYAASPLFNGNTDYRGYTDNRGVEIFCPERTAAQKLEKWQKAATACKEAIDFLEKAENGGHKLFEYTSTEYKISDVNRRLFTIRQAFTERENYETIWPYTKTYVSSTLQNGGIQNLLFSTKKQRIGILAVTLNFSELFYTKNGLPIDMDENWDYDSRYTLTTGKEEDYLLLKPGYEFPAGYQDREPRFYSDIAFDGSAWFGHGYTDETAMFYSTTAKTSTTNHYNENVTGLWARKWVNYKTVQDDNGVTTVPYPYPILSMNSLYLYYAEALNECGKDYSEVLPWVNKIRERAGIPDVETSWDTYSKSPGKYKTQIGLRDIIHRERTIELAFQGYRFWDQRRWKEAYNSWNCEIKVWNLVDINHYYQLNTLYTSKFEIKDYLWPIPNKEIYTNENIIQNPGW